MLEMLLIHAAALVALGYLVWRFALPHGDKPAGACGACGNCGTSEPSAQGPAQTHARLTISAPGRG